MKSLRKLIVSLLFIFLFFVGVTTAWAYNKPDIGFDKFGYNYSDRTFNGPADGVDKILDSTVFGNKTYATDQLKMSWSKAWNDARFNRADWTCKASQNYQWNGASKNGSGKIRHYKIVWVGYELENSPCWVDGGYSIWMEFEVIPNKGTVSSNSIFETHANPNGDKKM